MFDLTDEQLATLGLYGQVGGALSPAIGGFYQAQSQASTLKFQAEMAAINARVAETAAQSRMAQGHRQIGQVTARAGQIKSAQRAAMAANGIDLGEGNAAEVQASTDLMKENDVLTIQDNVTRDAWAMRTQGVNAQNTATVASAAAEGISPFGAAAGSLLGSAGKVADSWLYYRRLK